MLRPPVCQALGARASGRCQAPGCYLVRLYPCCSEEKSRRGWQRAKRSGTHDQMSLISFTLTISEWKFSACTAKCTNCLGRVGRAQSAALTTPWPRPGHAPRPGELRSLSGELCPKGASLLFPRKRDWGNGAEPWSPAPISYRGESTQPGWGQKHVFSNEWGHRVSQL